MTPKPILSDTAGHDYIPGLDGVRALAVLLVMVGHFGFSHIVPGGFGVTVFFFLSGFLITRLLVAEREESGRIQLKNFYLRRIVRLAPALLFMLAGSTLLVALVGIRPQPVEWLTALTYTVNYHQAALGEAPRNMPWGHLWSLAVEEHFYLLFPLLLIACGPRLKRAFVLLLGLAAAALVWRFTTIYGLGFDPGYNYLASETRMDSIIWGCLFALALHLYGRETIRRFGGPGPLALALAALAVGFLWRDEIFRETLRYSLQGAALFIAFAALYLNPLFGFAVRLLEWAPLRWTGRLSYSLYLWHMPVEALCSQAGLTGPAYIAAGFALSFAFAALSYYAVERPFLALRKRLRGAPVRVEPALAGANA